MEKLEPSVRISYDNMEAYLFLPAPARSDSYSIASILAILNEAGVKIGIDQLKIKEILEEELYDRDVLVAKGIPVEDGKDGYYEFNFNQELNQKPTVRADGSVDYWSIHSVETVEEGQVIAVYKEPFAGRDGYDVLGNMIPAQKGKSIPQLRGTGFERSSDNRVYIAQRSGKIEYKNNRIMITAVHEIFGNADLTTGNIDFRGDLIIHGNVTNGVKIKVSGNVTVDGIVEASEIYAGKSLIVRGGILGANKGYITAKENISTKFAEYAKLECAGDLESNSLLGCDVSCQGEIHILGRRGSIIGGSTYCVRRIECSNVGNETEVPTELIAGCGKDNALRSQKLQEELSETKKALADIETALKKFEELSKTTGVDYSKDERRVALLRTKIVKHAEIAAKEDEIEALQIIKANARGATIRVNNYLYPGVSVTIQDVMVVNQNTHIGVEFEEHAGKLRMYGVD